LLNKYEFPGDTIPIVYGRSKEALENATTDNDGSRSVDALMFALDTFVPLPIREEDKPLLMSVEDVFSIKGRGTVATGRIERGTARVGDEVEIIGLRKDNVKSTITGLEMFQKTLDKAIAGDNVGALLRGIDPTASNAARLSPSPAASRRTPSSRPTSTCCPRTKAAGIPRSSRGTSRSSTSAPRT